MEQNLELKTLKKSSHPGHIFCLNPIKTSTSHSVLEKFCANLSIVYFLCVKDTIWQ